MNTDQYIAVTVVIGSLFALLLNPLLGIGVMVVAAIAYFITRNR